MPDKTIRKTFSALKGLPTGHKHPKGGWTVCCTAEIDPTVERGGDIIRVDGMTWPGEVKLLAQHLRYASDGSPTVIGKATNFRKSSITFDGKPAKAILADIFFADSELAGKYKQLWPDFINEVSIGAMVDECEPLDQKNAFGGFDYTKTKGYELSVVTIPANPDYPVLNISHAAAILFYEMHQAPPKRGRTASEMEREKLHEALRDLMKLSDYPAHKFERTQVLFRRLVGRSMPSKWEFHALMGVFTRATKRIQRLEKKPS